MNVVYGISWSRSPFRERNGTILEALTDTLYHLFTEPQRKLVGSCLLWIPGLYFGQGQEESKQRVYVSLASVAKLAHFSQEEVRYRIVWNLGGAEKASSGPIVLSDLEREAKHITCQLLRYPQAHGATIFFATPKKFQQIARVEVYGIWFVLVQQGLAALEAS